jgi:hypothetical protein
MRLEGLMIRSNEKPNDLIGNRICDLSTCSIMPQPGEVNRPTTFILKIMCKS